MSDTQTYIGYGPVASLAWSPPVVLVGEQNPHGLDPRYALFDLPERAAGHRLRAKILGVRRTTYARFHRCNLCDTEAWSTPVAKDKAYRLRDVLPDCLLVLLGSKVSEAFGFKYEPFSAKWCDPTPTGIMHRIVMLPHPSARNRAWNEPGAAERARAVLRELRPEIPWGETNNE